ncbi:MAG: SMC-Scp complex subunit ScpB [Bdellovibrionales bacterium]
MNMPEPKTELRLLEAILFANDEPVSFNALQQHLGESADVGALLEELQTFYQGRGIVLVNNGDVWSFRTAPELAPLMKITKQPRRKLPKAASEVLAIISYHQPVTRAEIESIRGVETSKGTIDLLLEVGWIRPGKRRDTPGRPLTWKTTPEFLSHFNLTSLKDLPGIEDLKAAGLLDTRPILETMPSDSEATKAAAEDEQYANWVEEE